MHSLLHSGLARMGLLVESHRGMVQQIEKALEKARRGKLLLCRPSCRTSGIERLQAIRYALPSTQAVVVIRHEMGSGAQKDGTYVQSRSVSNLMHYQVIPKSLDGVRKTGVDSVLINAL